MSEHAVMPFCAILRHAYSRPILEGLTGAPIKIQASEVHSNLFGGVALCSESAAGNNRLLIGRPCAGWRLAVIYSASG